MIRIPFRVNRLENDSYHIAVTAEINRQKGAMIIDTGASKTVVDKAFVKDTSLLSNKSKNIISAGLGGKINLAIATLEEIKLADFVINSFTVAVIDLSSINKLYQSFHEEHIIGLLGSDFLTKNKAVIDYPQKALFLQ